MQRSDFYKLFMEIKPLKVANKSDGHIFLTQELENGATKAGKRVSFCGSSPRTEGSHTEENYKI